MQDALRTFSMSHLTHLIEGDGGVVELVQVRVAGLVDVRPRRRLDLQENGIGFSETVRSEEREEKIGCCQLDRRYFERQTQKQCEALETLGMGAFGDNFPQGRAHDLLLKCA